MKKVLLDTSFILHAIRNKIDFLEEILFMGMTPLLPKQVLRELKSIVNSKKKLRFKDEARLALDLFEKIKNKSKNKDKNKDPKKIKTIDLNEDYVDKGIVRYAKKHKNIVIATMDYNLKKQIKNQKLVVRAGKKLEVV
ncbi:hypothetical protein GF378_00835 [Candidatus Pacearchaeota archaeon]|nr:hypothetical protein [Candidatus Pacearchaeota archaeon]